MLDRPDKYLGTYRIASARMPGFDYGSNGHYFVTICAAGKRHHFGEVVDDRMKLSEAGRIADACWREIPEHLPNCRLYELVVMPNHIHGIIIIERDSADLDAVETGHCPVSKTEFSEKSDIVRDKETGQCPVSTKNASLSSVVGSYKSACTKSVRLIIEDFAWQARFYDHVIRKEESLDRIREYIRNNPANWNKDEYFMP